MKCINIMSSSAKLDLSKIPRLIPCYAGNKMNEGSALFDKLSTFY